MKNKSAKKLYTYRATPEQHKRLAEILIKKGFKYGRGASLSKAIEAIIEDELLLILKKDLTN